MSLLFLGELGEDDGDRVGAKAATLARLKRLGFPVPDAFVLTPDGPIEEEQLAAALSRLGGPVAVRSSSTAEDQAGASFAGQYETLLDVSGPAAVLSAARACRASAEAGMAYARAVGALPGRMAVLVQRMVEPRAAGVAFTLHPRDESRMLVEAFAGRGDAVASGRIAPDRYVVDRDTGTLREGPRHGSLAPAALAEVVGLARRVEQQLNGPQDLEWAIGEEGAVVLQARPITVRGDAALDPRLRRLTRANVGEVLPDAVTPLTWTTVGAFLEHAFRSVASRAGLVAEDAPPFLVLHQQRLFLNLSLGLEIASRIPGVSPQDAERLVLGSGNTTARGERPRVKEWPSALRIGLRLLRLARGLQEAILAAEATVASLPAAAAIQAADTATLRGLMERFAGDGRRLAATHILSSGASATRLALLGRLLQGAAPGDPVARLNRLVAGLDDLESATPALALQALASRLAQDPQGSAWLAASAGKDAPAAIAGAPAAVRAELASFLARHGHRGLSEGELAAPAWEDDPSPLLSALRTLAASPRAVEFERRARAEAARTDESALLARLSPLRRELLRAAIRHARRGVRERERTKSLSVALAHHGRRLARAAARRLVEQGALASASDVFFLEWQELLGMLGGAPRLPPAVLLRRRRRFEREGALEVPRELDLAQGACSPPNGGSPHEAGRLGGIGASGGVGRGKARVLAPGRPPHLEPGEVLVTGVLDAALGPLLVTAAGAVAEIGGMLSHGAVVARELGVPCVVDVRGATALIRTGDHVLVDGTRGLVQLGQEPPEAEAPRPAAGPMLAAPTAEEAEALHSLGAHPKARESVYFAVQDPASGLRLLATLARKAGGQGEALVALALPDGRTLFGLDLAPARGVGAGFAVGGSGAEFQPPRLQARIRLAPHEAEDFPPGPLPLLLAARSVPVVIDLTLRATTPAHDFCQALPQELLAALRPLGDHHLEQSGEWTGSITIDDRRYEVEATGHRDHSWGLRDWDALDHSRLFVARFGDELAVHALSLSVGGRHVEGGFLARGRETRRIESVRFASERHGPRLHGIEVEIVPVAGPVLRLRGRVERTLRVPVQVARRPWPHLAGRPYALILEESFVRYEAEGRVGYGMAELSERPQ